MLKTRTLSGAALSSLENDMWAEMPIVMVCTPSSHGGHREAQAGTIPEAVGKIGPAPDTISVPLVIEAQNSSCAQGVVKETGEKITLIVQTFYRFRVLIVHDWKKR